MNDNRYIIITILKFTTCASKYNDFFCRVYNMYNIRRRKIRLNRLTPTCVVSALYKRTTEDFRSPEINFLFST